MATWGTWNKGHCQGLWPWWAKGNSGGWRKRHESWASRQQCSVFHVILWFIRLNGRYLIAEDSETSTPDSLAARGFSSPGQPRLNAYCLSRPFTFQAWRWAHLILGESFFSFQKIIYLELHLEKKVCLIHWFTRFTCITLYQQSALRVQWTFQLQTVPPTVDCLLVFPIMSSYVAYPPCNNQSGSQI